jgi:hypothetical protein
VNVRAAGLALLLAAASASPSTASTLSEIRGHMGLGYSKLFIADGPAGSLSVGAGLDVPAGPIRAGVDIGFHLLGGRTVTSGSLIANVDYSAFEADLLAHWTPPWRGPLGRLSVGPALFSARAELSTSGGGLAFSNLAVEETVPGAVVIATLLSRSQSPVRVGLEASFRRAFLNGDDWALGAVRLAFYY